MAKIAIVEDRRIRAPIEVARDFVRQQSVGEWDDETIEQDAKALAKVLNAYGVAHVGINVPDLAVEYEP